MYFIRVSASLALSRACVFGSCVCSIVALLGISRYLKYRAHICFTKLLLEETLSSRALVDSPLSKMNREIFCLTVSDCHVTHSSSRSSFLPPLALSLSLLLALVFVDCTCIVLPRSRRFNRISKFVKCEH